MFVLDFHGRGALRSFLPPADVTVTEQAAIGAPAEREPAGATA